MKTLLARPFVDSTIGNSPPLSLMYLSSYLKSQGMETELFDSCADKKSLGGFPKGNSAVSSLIGEIKSYGADAIGMTLFSKELEVMASFCNLLKQEMPETKIILGGPHPTAMPDQTLEIIQDCDIIIRGEGEKAIVDLVKSLEGDSPLENVKGISYRENSHIRHTEEAEIISNLNALPLPDRMSVLHNYKNGNYSSLLYGSPSDTLMTSRGCPFQCHFCFKVCDLYRSRSPENVMEEIDWIAKHISPESIQIMDDSFTIQKSRCHKILDMLLERNYPTKFKIRSRVNAVNDELLGKMRAVGVDTIVYGLESGSQKMLNAFNKKTSVEENIRACEMTRKAGINCLGDMILFYPGETKETLKETEDFVSKANPTAVKFYVLTPLPKTRVYEDAKETGMMVGDWGATGETPWIKLPDFKDVGEMESIAKKMFIKSLLRPGRLYWVMKPLISLLRKNFFLAVNLVFYNLFKRRKY